MLRALFSLIVVAAVVATPALAAKGKGPKKPEKPSWVVLVHGEGDVPSSWAAKLRAAAEKAQTDRAWVDPPAVTLDEAAAVVGCGPWGPGCAAQVAGMTGAQNALVIDLKRTGAVVAVAAFAVDAAGNAAGSDNDRVEVGADDDGFKVAVAWVQGAVKGARPTVLVLTADVDPTDVVIDNTPVGKTPLTLVDSVAAGPHALLFKREGKAPLSRQIEVKAGVVNRENGVLSAGGPLVKSTPTVGDTTVLPTPVPTPPPATEGPNGLALVGWGVTGVGGAVGLGGLVASTYLFVDRNIVASGYSLCRDGDGALHARFHFGCEKDVVNNTRDQAFLDEIGEQLPDMDSQMAVAFVVLGAGALLAGTGAGLVVAAGGGEAADDAAVTPTPPPSTPAPAK